MAALRAPTMATTIQSSVRQGSRAPGRDRGRGQREGQREHGVRELDHAAVEDARASRASVLHGRTPRSRASPDEEEGQRIGSGAGLARTRRRPALPGAMRPRSSKPSASAPPCVAMRTSALRLQGRERAMQGQDVRPEVEARHAGQAVRAEGQAHPRRPQLGHGGEADVERAVAARAQDDRHAARGQERAIGVVAPGRSAPPPAPAAARPAGRGSATGLDPRRHERHVSQPAAGEEGAPLSVAAVAGTAARAETPPGARRTRRPRRPSRAAAPRETECGAWAASDTVTRSDGATAARRAWRSPR